jgi:hypothetical protein
LFGQPNAFRKARGRNELSKWTQGLAERSDALVFPFAKPESTELLLMDVESEYVEENELDILNLDRVNLTPVLKKMIMGIYIVLKKRGENGLSIYGLSTTLKNMKGYETIDLKLLDEALIFLNTSEGRRILDLEIFHINPSIPLYRLLSN